MCYKRISLLAPALVVLGLTAHPAAADEFTKEELQKWRQQFRTVVEKGEKLFHSSELGSNGHNCAGCHPDAANTHPETYPKLQKQLGQVAELRNMINWCIENPLEGKPLPLDSEELMQLEAYINWERRGVALDPGKH
ncbi:c-type cytochrome [Thiohalorhabdus sp. Cl-TMA]|uniref:C-type cytochrome n=1 Tax=Thiohalorhabdus methylotrophus TaxID=3242694 RepID=A0ABV4TVW9_9GAMM